MGKSTYVNFQDYLIHKELLHLEGEALEKARKEYRKEYMRSYMKTRRKNHVRVELLFTAKQVNYLDEHIAIYGSNRSTFCKKIILQTIHNEPILIHEESLQKLILEVKRIGNLTNQIVRHIHSQRKVYPIQISTIQNHLRDLEQQITEYFEINGILTNAHQNSKS